MTHRPEQDPDAVIVECEFDQPPETVWRALTVPEFVAQWLGPANIKPEPGTRFKVQDGPARQVDCQVLAAEPPHLIRYSWRTEDVDSVVCVQLAATREGGTHLRLVHSDFVEITSAVARAHGRPVSGPAFAPERPRRMHRIPSRRAASVRVRAPTRLAA